MSFIISLFSIVEKDDDIREYMGISYIKAYLDSKGLECTAKVITKDEIGDILNQYDEFPQLIGVSIYCNNQELVKLFCKKVKEISSDCHICLGGAHVLNYEYEILMDCPYVDSICSGDGEETFYDLAVRLINGKSLMNCNGITFREKDKIVKNGKRIYLNDLDDLPFPYRERNVKNKKKYLYITGSRGCLGRCTFCAEYLTGGVGVRLRSAKNIVDEMEYLSIKYDVHTFHFTDATFEDPGKEGIERVKGIFNEIISRNLTFRLVMFTRSNLVKMLSDDYYNLAYRAGVECFFVGIESGNEMDMKLYTKGANVKDNISVIRKILNHNIYVNFGFICFNPYSTYETIQANLDFLYQSRLIFNAFHFLSKLTIMPQAVMRKKLLKDGLIEEFHYDSDITVYKFIHPEVKELYDYLSEVLNIQHLIDYDSQIAMDYNHYKKTMPDFFDNNLKEIFENIFEIWNRRKEYLYQFFSNCISMHKVNKADSKFLEYLSKNTVNEYDMALKKCYFKYLLVIKRNMKQVTMQFPICN